VWLVLESFRMQCNWSRSLANLLHERYQRASWRLMLRTRCECNLVQNRGRKKPKGKMSFSQGARRETFLARNYQRRHSRLTRRIQEHTRHVAHKFPANAPDVSCIRNTEGCAARFSECDVGGPRLCTRDRRKTARDVGINTVRDTTALL